MACLLGGGVIIATSASLNLQAALSDTLPEHATVLDAFQAGIVSPIGLVILALAFGSAAAVSGAMLASRHKQAKLVFLCFVGMFAAEVYSGILTAERILVLREAKTRAALEDNQPRRIVEGRIERLSGELAQAVEAVRAESKNGGCGRICRDLRKEEAAVRERLTTAEAELAKLPPARIENHLANVSGVGAVWWDLGAAVLGAFALFAFGAFFVGLGTRMLIGNPSAARPAPQVDAEPSAITRDEALTDLRRMLAKTGHVPEQRLLAARWNVTPGCVSKWLSAWEKSGEIRRTRDGKSNIIAAA
jgi:hypothetical protein